MLKKGRIQSYWMGRCSSGEDAALFQGGTWSSGLRGRAEGIGEEERTF